MSGASSALQMQDLVCTLSATPDNCPKIVLNYQQRGLEIELQGRKFTAWAVQNELDSESSYFVKVDGTGFNLFSPYPLERMPKSL